MNAALLNQAMDAMLAEIDKARRNLTSAFYVRPAAAEETVRLSLVAQRTLEDLRKDVVGSGGVHGTPQKAWEAWVDLAQDTVTRLNEALNYSDRVSLTAWIKKGAGAFVDTGTALVDMGKDAAKATGAGLSLVALVLGLLVVLQFQRGRA